MLERHSLRRVSLAILILLFGMSANDRSRAQDVDQVFVMGGVVNPTAISLKEPITLGQAIAKAGGPLKDKKYEKVNIIRLREKGNMSTCASLREARRGEVANLKLQANDILEITRGKCERSMCWTVNQERPVPLRIIQ